MQNAQPLSPKVTIIFIIFAKNYERLFIKLLNHDIMKKFLSIMLTVLVVAGCATTEASAKKRRSAAMGNKNAAIAATSVKNAYIKLLEKMQKRSETDKYEYFLFDINGDNVPEMFMQIGTCDMDYKMHVYTYSNGRVREITSGTSLLNPWASGYKEKDGVLVIADFARGSSKSKKITLVNNRIKTTLIKDNFDSFEFVDTYYIDEYDPIENLE